MQSTVAKTVASLSLLTLAGNVAAHPGSHAAFTGWEQVTHFISNPDHVAMLMAGMVVLSAVIVWSVGRKG